MNNQVADTFKILKEQTINYQGEYNDQLYFMLIKNGQQYFITVDSRTIRIGQCEVFSYSTGLNVFEHLVYRMAKYPGIQEAFKTLDIGLSFNEINPLMFFVQACNKVVSSGFIMKLKKTLQFQTKPLYPDMELWSKDDDVSIEVLFDGYSEAFGQFEKLKGSDTYFRFIVNDFYFFRI